MAVYIAARRRNWWQWMLLPLMLGQEGKFISEGKKDAAAITVSKEGELVYFFDGCLLGRFDVFGLIDSRLDLLFPSRA